jgi:hypothetical protein
MIDTVRGGRMVGVFRHSGLEGCTLFFFFTWPCLYDLLFIYKRGIHACFSSKGLFLMCL